MNNIVDSNTLEVLHDPVNRNPFLKMFGLELVESAGGHAYFVQRENPELMNVYGVAHGGVIMTLFDVALASAALSKNNFTTGIVTLDMSINFIGPGAGRLHVRGHATGGGSTVCFCEGEIHDDAGKLVAKAIGSFKYRRKPGAQAGRMQPA
ncbi:PaaI family thioesterase [Noviherbaspirillum sp.]|uniref:PaaI family thioesterase n=1 Tax=Noviherbaspirillum sp. TaxID=1926288 RepID=UPI002FE3D43E